MRWILTLIQTRRNQYIAFMIMAILSFGLFFHYVFHNPHFWYSNLVDAHYYISIARNLHDGMGFYDGTSIPKGPIVTPQNGIVFIELLLMKAGIHGKISLYMAMATINYLFLLFSAFLLYKIADDLKVAKPLTLLIIANFLFSGSIFTAISVPTNDGIAFALSLLGLFLCIKNHENHNNWIYLLIFTISVIGAHFRVQCILIPFSAAFASLIVKRYRSFLIYLLTTVSSFLLVYFPYRYLMEGGYSIHETRQHLFSFVQIDKIGKVITDFGIGFSQLFLKFGEGGGHGLTGRTAPFFAVIGALIIYYCIRKVVSREFKTMLLSLVILSTIAMYLFLPWHTFRYIMIIMPLLMIILGSTFRWKYELGPVFVAYLVYSIGIIIFRVVSIEPYYYEQKRQTELVMPLFKNDVTLFSEDQNISYFLFNQPSRLDFQLADSKNDVILFGSNEFVMKGISKIKSEFPNVKIDDYGQHWMVSTIPFHLKKLTLLP